jgi:hypothetical protein
MAQEHPICGDHLREAKRARLLADSLHDAATCKALLLYAHEQEELWKKAFVAASPLDSGPMIL